MFYLLLHSYNHIYHTSIKRTPVSVNAKNQEEALLTLYGDENMQKPKLKTGDKFAILKIVQRLQKVICQVGRRNSSFWRSTILQNKKFK